MESGLRANDVCRLDVATTKHQASSAPPSAQRIPLLKAGEVDLVVKTMTINCNRWGQIDFSTVYYNSGQKLLVDANSTLESIDEVTDETICAVAGTTSLDNLTERAITTVEGADWTDCLVAFQQGRAQGVSTDDTILAGLAFQDPYAKVLKGEAFTEEPYGIGLPKGHPEFTRFVNAVLAQARADGTWQALYDEWLTNTLGPAKDGPPVATYRPDSAPSPRLG